MISLRGGLHNLGGEGSLAMLLQLYVFEKALALLQVD